MKYWIDWSSWLIEAKSEKEAADRAISLVKGKIPAISCITKEEEYHNSANEITEFE